MKVLKSKFVPSYKVVHLTEKDQQYESLKKVFDKHGYAFLAQSTIFIDESKLKRDDMFTSGHLLFIESHEIAHAVLGHSKTHRDPTQEAEADYVGILLCKDKNDNNSAIEVGKKYFEIRNGISYKDFHVKHGKKLHDKIK